MRRSGLPAGRLVVLFETTFWRKVVEFTTGVTTSPKLSDRFHRSAILGSTFCLHKR